MPRKKITEGKVDVKKISFADLHALYQFIASSCGTFVNNQATAYANIGARLKEVEDELYNRAFGGNPYKVTVVVEGQKPEEVIPTLKQQKQPKQEKLPKQNVKNDGEAGAIVVKLEEPATEENPVEQKVESETPAENFVVAEKNTKIEDKEVPRFVVAGKE